MFSTATTGRLRRVLTTATLTTATLVGGLLAGCSAGPGVADPPAELVIASGESSGVYYRYGQGLAGALAAELPDTDVHVTTSSGSVDNVEQLVRGEVQLGFALADTAAEAVAGTGP